MVYYMTGETVVSGQPEAAQLTPRQIVSELDRYIVGQDRAKRAVAIALRNRMRRLRLPPEMAEEVAPKNIIMIGPTGVGKTEIARRLARLARSPFLKVEATKFTEVGYVGRDVESMVRDLTEIAIDLVRQERVAEVRDRAKANVEERLLGLLGVGHPPETADETLRGRLAAGELDDTLVEVEVSAPTGSMPLQIFGPQGMEEINFNLREMMPGLFGSGRPRRRRMTVREAREHLLKEEEDKLIDMEQAVRDAVTRVEQSGIIFIDEIDKVAGRDGRGSGPDVSREGVQRDLLPIIEGTTVSTKYGMVRTDHVLFIASGAFHMAKPSDLMPEMQGRFPIRVELDALTRDDFVRILTEPENALVRQYVALMEVEGITLTFTPDGIRALADYAALVNEKTEDIGARRLHTIMEKVLDEILFEGPDLPRKVQVIDAEYTRRRLADIVQDQDLSRYIL
ncbi:MAG TPA: ATP-dependent protease ATPase subunit HslU [Candidatus Polarisedimenticolia bacterium]|jgi:ATP-dependent HslUV protease ATP-binding subunit HslU